MGKKFYAAVKKELLILIRDKVGLSILFIMPMVLVLVMTLIQDSAFRSVNERGIPIVFVNYDNDSLGIYIYKGLKNSSLCSLTDSINSEPATETSAKKAVAEGKFILGVVIPKGATEAIRKIVKELLSHTLPSDTKISEAKPDKTDSVNILLYIDPVAKKTFISSITSSLHEFFASVKTQIMFQVFSQQIAALIPDNSKAPENTYSKSQILNYKEIYASRSIGDILPNAVQHNVPAWTIFAMFFIVVPLVGSIMKEKKEGSVFRLHTMPASYLLLLNGKITVYVIVCFLQFILMIAIGLYILPLFGLPVLQLGNSLSAITILALSTALAAIGYGVMIATMASSEQQGAILGSLSILLLSALGGILVPTYVMPEIMRKISLFSPLNWSLDGFYKLFLRGVTVEGILPNAFKLILFFITTVSISSFIDRVKHKI